jgi:peptidoglycan/LPS O-acetylase OafA/YrhL
VQAPAPLAWLTPGVLAGFIAGLALLSLAARLPRAAKFLVAAICIVVATAAINLAPENPYQSVPPRLLAKGAGHFLSFTEIARALSELWPLLATGFLIFALCAQRGRASRPGNVDPI